ncbi:MAG: HlyC/CorC family transporter [Lachnospiraceae bacterium]|nr:HlyC/CorC family transporter [Lachnospiraceae bacterium]
MDIFKNLIKKDNVNEDEIISMVNEGHEQGVLDSSEAQMITNIFEFGDKEARDIMTHRENIISVDCNEKLEDVAEFMLDGKNSRCPVYEDNIDNIIGIIHFKDVMKANVRSENRNKPLKELEGIIKEAHFIPETRKIDILFKSMQQKKIHMVIVVDEYGQTAGIVCMEDILEEIVGNILDEFDEDEVMIRMQGDDTYICDGLALLSDVGEKLGIEFPEEGYETLNGFMTDRLGHIPKSGEDFEVEFSGWKFRIAYVKGRIVKTVRITKVLAAG